MLAAKRPYTGPYTGGARSDTTWGGYKGGVRHLEWRRPGLTKEGLPQGGGDHVEDRDEARLPGQTAQGAGCCREHR
eukprot:55099-Rhodomonas_salina.1